MKQYSMVHHMSSCSSSSSSSPRLITRSILFLLFLCFFFTTTNATVKLPPNVTVPALIVFGDSIVDAGNNNNFKTVSKSNFFPYGIDFNGGVPTGRFSNGKIPSDLLAEELGIKEAVPAYLDPNLKPEDLLTGVTFASGGAGFYPLTNKIAVAISMTDQMKYFEEYIEKLEEMVGEERTNFILANSLYLIVIGSNDIANTYFGLPVIQRKYDIATYTTLLVDYASTFLKELYGYGARRIFMLGAPPVGCLPSQRTIAGGVARACIKRFNDACELYNSKLSATVVSLTATLPESRIVYGDIYNPLLGIILNPQNYGFKVANRGCCGTGYIEVTFTCNTLTSAVCPIRSDHVFWDSYHPTETGYRVLISMIIDKYADKFF